MATDTTTPPPATSTTQDTYTHHTSPADPAGVQAPLVKVPVKTPTLARPVTGTPRKIVIPDHITKHSNPVGRPRNPRP